jgi:hypothetical protein
MSAWVTFPSSVHRAAIAGKVVDGLDAQRALEGVLVTITAMPPAFQAVVSARGAASPLGAASACAARPDRTITAADGVFRFADLPDGPYTLSFSLPRGSYGGAKRDVTVARDAKGDIALAVQVVALPPTGVRGRVQGRVPGGSPAALSLSRVRVRGSGERAYGDADGGFTLAGLEPGPRVLELSASGFQPATATASVVEGAIVEIAPVVLEPST